VIELKQRGKEKRARLVLTRPEPTIFGNCEGWKFIVGKKQIQHRQKLFKKRALQGNNENLSTVYSQNKMGI
jgi:hypothetical protein